MLVAWWICNPRRKIVSPATPLMMSMMEDLDRYVLIVIQLKDGSPPSLITNLLTSNWSGSILKQPAKNATSMALTEVRLQIVTPAISMKMNITARLVLIAPFAMIRVIGIM